MFSVLWQGILFRADLVNLTPFFHSGGGWVYNAFVNLLGWTFVSPLFSYVHTHIDRDLEQHTAGSSRTNPFLSGFSLVFSQRPLPLTLHLCPPLITTAKVRSHHLISSG